MRRTVAVALAWCAVGALACDPEGELTMGEVPRTLSVGDVNGDGAPDLVVTSPSEPADTGLEPEQILVRLGDGSGSFGDIQRSAGPNLAEHTFLADMNRDQRLDLVSTDFYGTVNVYSGDGAGHFSFSQMLGNCERAPGGAAGELNGDGLADLAILCREEGTTYLNTFFGSASGQLVLGDTYDLLPSRFLPADIEVGDLNADGRMDLVIVGSVVGQPSAVAHLNDGAGAFTALPPVAAASAALALADMNGDSILDAVAAGSSLVVLRGTGTGVLSPAVAVAADVSLTDVAVADINGDGRPDIVGTGSTGLSVFTAQASGGYTRRDLDAGTNPGDVAITDVDHDGAPDALLLNRNTPEARGNVNVFFNDSL